MPKRSAAVVLGMFATLALSACGDSDPTHSQICVDEKSKQRVEDDDCRRGTSGRGWFYIPYSRPAPAVGSGVDTTSGSYVKPSGSRVSTVSRGGFGGRVSGGGS